LPIAANSSTSKSPASSSSLSSLCAVSRVLHNAYSFIVVSLRFGLVRFVNVAGVFRVIQIFFVFLRARQECTDPRAYSVGVQVVDGEGTRLNVFKCTLGGLFGVGAFNGLRDLNGGDDGDFFNGHLFFGA
jgi:hypothetical protein